MQLTLQNDGAISVKLVFIAATAALGGFLFGYDSSIINGTVGAVRTQFELSASAVGFTVSCALLGAMVGAWYAGICAERVGRVRTMMIASLLLSASALGSGLAFGVADLVWWRFVGGVGVGFASVIAPAYIAEISPSQQRGRLATMQQMALVIGIFCALLISALIANVSGSASAEVWLGLEAWRWMFLSELLPAIAYGLLATLLPESPRYLVERQRLEEASQVLRRVVGITNTKQNRDKIIEIQETVASEEKHSFRDLLGGQYYFLPLVWVGILLSVFQQFVGINVIFYYSTTLWQSVGFQESDSFLISVIMATTNIVATIIAISLIDILGRKRLLLIGSGIMAISLAAMAVSFSQAIHVNGELTLPSPWGEIALVAANLFIIGFGASWGPVVWVLLGEMFPNRIRAMALGIGGAAQWLANFFVSTTFPSLAALGLQYAYSLYAAFAFISFFFVWYAVNETNGRSLEEMCITGVKKKFSTAEDG